MTGGGAALIERVVTEMLSRCLELVMELMLSDVNPRSWLVHVIIRLVPKFPIRSCKSRSDL